MERKFKFTIRFAGPLDIPASFDLFRFAGDDQIDRWDGKTLIRTTPSNAEFIPYTCKVKGTVQDPALEVTVAEPSHKAIVKDTVSTVFITADEPLSELVSVDPVVAALNARYPGVRPVLQSDPLSALVRCISAQQVNLQWAVTLRSRLAAAVALRNLRLSPATSS